MLIEFLVLSNQLETFSIDVRTSVTVRAIRAQEVTNSYYCQARLFYIVIDMQL